jgi:UDP-glucose 4-epimerase
VVEAWLAAWDNAQSYGKVYNVASGQKSTVSDLIEALKQVLGCPDYPVEFQEGTPGDQFGVVGDYGALARDLQWQSQIPLREGLERLAAFEKRRLKGGCRQ